MFIENEVMEMALDMVSPITEAVGQGMKQLLSEDAKAGDRALNDARKLKKSGDKVGAKKKYQEAIKYYNKVRTNANKIENETVLDWFISFCLKPTVFLVYQAIQADFKLYGLTRESTLREIDNAIDQVKREMSLL